MNGIDADTAFTEIIRALRKQLDGVKATITSVRIDWLPEKTVVHVESEEMSEREP